MSILSVDVGIKNLAICVMSNDKTQIKYFDVLDLRTCPNMRDSVITEFTKRKEHFVDIDVCLVEQQLKKVFMVIAAYIEMWVRLSIPDCKVFNYSAKHKLASLKVTGQKWTYAQRKKASINMVNEWLSKNQQSHIILDKWGALKKRDDAADAICQALSYVSASKQKRIVIARMPTANRTKLYARSHIKYLLSHGAEIDKDEQLRLSIAQFYHNVGECLSDLGLSDLGVSEPSGLKCQEPKTDQVQRM